MANWVKINEKFDHMTDQERKDLVIAALEKVGLLNKGSNTSPAQTENSIPCAVPPAEV